MIANEDGGAVRVIGTFVNNSDARCKTGIAPLENALNAVLNLRGVAYDWRKDLPDLHLQAGNVQIIALGHDSHDRRHAGAQRSGDQVSGRKRFTFAFVVGWGVSCDFRL